MKLTNRSLTLYAAILVATGIAGINFFYGRSTAASECARLDPAERKRISLAYTQLPLRFEANAGQVDEQVKFFARGAGYSILLRPEEALLQLRGAERGNRDEGGREFALTTLRMKLVAANRTPRIYGLNEQSGKTNYFIGRKRLVGVAGFDKVRYENIWNGVDLIFYGNQQQLEYDFRLAPGADPKHIRLAFEGGEALKIDGQGALIARAGSAEVRWLRPVAFQEVNGARREVACGYRIRNKNQIEFELGRYDANLPLVIDPVLVYSTFLGGLFDDFAYGPAVDGAGNAYIAGSTNSLDFPTVNPVQTAIGSRNRADAFVLKIAPNGSNLIYATYLGGSGGDTAYSIAVDESGNAWIAGETDSTDFPRTAGSLQQNSGGFADAFVARLNATGSQLIYSTYIGGDFNDSAFGLAIDSGGNAYVTGRTDSTNFPTVGATRSNNATPFFKTTDAAANWSASGNGLPNATVQAIAFSPGSANTIFAATALGLFKSADGGGQWSFNGLLPTISGIQPVVSSISFDPMMPTIIYLATSQGVYKSFNGGVNFQLRSIGLPGGNVFTLRVDPVNTATLYAGTSFGVYKSTNGGESWLSANIVSGDNLGSTTIRSLVFDPTNPLTIYAGTSRGVYRTVNGAGAWAAVNTGLGTGSSVPAITALAIDPVAANMLYAAANTANAVLFKTTDGGARWQPSDNGLSATVGGVVMRMAPVTLAIDQVAPATVYAGAPLGVFKTIDGGSNWSLASSGLATRNITALAIDPAATNTVYAGTVAGSDAFVAKLNAGGSGLVYSIYLGGDQSDIGRGIAVDNTGAAWVTGQTDSPNFPTANPLQARINGMNDAFVTKINPAGSAPAFSTFLGGGALDAGNSIALDVAGNAYVAGATSSNNFPTSNAFKNTYGGGSNDGFVTKYTADGSAVEYSTYLGGQNDDQIFAITIDRGDNVWVTGSTSSSDFPVVNSLKEFDFEDAFVARFNATGRQLLFSTYLGGSFGSDNGRAIAVDTMSNAYVAGVTSSFDFPQINPVRASNSPTNGFAVKIGPAADLAVTMTAQPEPVLAGAQLTYRITVANNGDLPVTGVKLTDSLPQGATFVSATASMGGCSGTSEITCDLGNLALAATAQVTIIVNAPATRTTSNTVRISANEAEPKTENNTTIVTNQIETADLALTNTATHLQIGAGGKLGWVMTVRNLSRVKTGSITINDNLAAETTFVSCTATIGTCSGSGNNSTATVPSLDAESSATFVVTAMVNNNVSPGVTLTNTAGIAPVSYDPNTNNNQSNVTTTVVAASPSEVRNGLIAFGHTGVSLVRSDGSGRFQFTSGHHPAWSPDGTRLAFGSGQGISIINADGSGARVLTNNGSSPAWSPDGTRIAFHRFLSGIIIVNADGTGERIVSNRFSNNIGVGFRWSPDGARLAITSGSLFVGNIDGSEVKQLTAFNTVARDGAPAWSPDGSKIIFAGGSNVASGPLFIINADGSELKQLGTDLVAYPAWSPDGSKIAYSSGNSRLFVSNADGTSPARIVDVDPNNPINGIDWQRAPAAQPRTFVISGRLRGPNNSPVFTTVELRGTRTATTGSSSDGFYSFGNLPEGGNYTINPISNFFRFDPPSRTYNNLTADQPNADFAATRIVTTIRGRIIDYSGAPMGGVIVSLGSDSRTETDAEGNFVFLNLSGGTSYTVTPIPIQGGDLFEPRSINFPASEGDKIAHFKGVRERFTLSGQVVDGAGASVGDVAITLNGAGQNATVATNSQGRYSFADLPSGYIYTVTASKPGVTISPATRRVLLSRNLDVRFFSGISSFTTVSAASFNPQGVTVGGIVALFGEGLAATTRQATGTTLPFELDGVSVSFSNRNLSSVRCQLFFISPRQINAIIPLSGFPSDASSIAGEALIEVRQGTRVVAASSVQIERVAPAIFTADSSGRGLAAAVALRVKADGAQVFEPIFRFDTQSGQFVAVPVDLSNPPEQVFLVLFGMGIRFRTDPMSVRVRIGGEDAAVNFAGAHTSLIAVDQVNALIPRTLAGRGDVDVVVTVDGKVSNTVRFNTR